MLVVKHKRKILDSIVVFDIIDMMHNLLIFKIASKLFLHYKNVLSYITFLLSWVVFCKHHYIATLKMRAVFPVGMFLTTSKFRRLRNIFKMGRALPIFKTFIPRDYSYSGFLPALAGTIRSTLLGFRWSRIKCFFTSFTDYIKHIRIIRYKGWICQHY